MTAQQPEALRLAEMLTADEWPGSVTLVSYARECVAELRRQHARITELESQLAQRFDAADMATASAQGFRDWVASVSAGSEPVAWKHDCAALLANDVELWIDACPHCGKPRMHATQAANPSPPEGMAGWISVDERLPEVGVTVLVYEPFRHGEDWPGTVRILFDYICPDYEDWHDHCASHEHFMAVGGANACGPDVTCTGPSEKAPYTHWMKLPEAPNA